MGISYKKLWITLAQKEISKAEFRKRVGISASTLTKLNKNEYIALSILVKICDFLECDICDVVEIVKKYSWYESYSYYNVAYWSLVFIFVWIG